MNKTQLLLLVSLFILAGLLSSCFSTYYVPHAINVPLPKGKKEFTGNALFGGSVRPGMGHFFSSHHALRELPEWKFDLQGAYSISNHIAITSNININKLGAYIGGGGGYYYNHKRLHFALYQEIGWGKTLIAR